MQFLLSISLDNAEAAGAGPGQVLPGYLRQVIARIHYGCDYPGSWRIRDGNGNTIGQFTITEDNEQETGNG